MIPKRYEMNLGVLDKTTLQQLQNTTVTVVGLGGLGGNVVNQLVRLGVTHFNLVDFDVFSESNLNRQLFSTVDNLGKLKVDVIKEELLRVHPDINVDNYPNKVQDININTDYIIDCVDNIDTKLFLEDLATILDVPLLHGSCGGWYGQVAVIKPGSNLLHQFYGDGEVGLEKELLNPPFTPSVVASYMVSEFTKLMINPNQVKYNQILLIDVLHNTLLETGDSNG